MPPKVASGRAALLRTRIPRAVAAGAVWLLALGLKAPAQPNAGSVQLELRIPPAETYVIGDAIPLYWQFQNRSDQPLGFLWEGCCRLNGQLVVRAADGAVPTQPPVQALAHMFAKADRLDPGVPKEYHTLVSDWVVLRDSGAYTLRGTYRGILPTQFPQAPRGLALWRDEAVSPPLSLRVQSVEEYLASRDARVRQRGIRVTAHGPERLPPLAPATFQIRFENLGSDPESFLWPTDAALWVLNSENERVAPMAVLLGTVGPISVPAGGQAHYEFTLSSDRFEDQPLGDYRWFVDLPASGPDGPRVPSNVAPLAWRMNRTDVRNLLLSAASGAGTGARNAPLRLLRIYLTDVGPILDDLDRLALPTDARGLADRLSQAARLKPIAPQPGPVELELTVPPSGPARWSHPTVASVAGTAGDTSDQQLEHLLDLRRHLGWDIRLVLQPTPATPMGRLSEVARGLDQQRELGAPSAVHLSTGATNEPARILLSGSPAARGPALRLNGPLREWSRDGQAFEPIEDSPEVARSLRADVGPALPIRVISSATVPWSEVRTALRSWIQPGARFLWMPTASP